jgi:hypothetical protein
MPCPGSDRFEIGDLKRIGISQAWVVEAQAEVGGMGFAPVLRYIYCTARGWDSAREGRCPTRKTRMSIDQFIDNEVKGNEVVLFMKGTPQFPMCFFSGKFVQILD